MCIAFLFCEYIDNVAVFSMFDECPPKIDIFSNTSSLSSTRALLDSTLPNEPVEVDEPLMWLPALPVISPLTPTCQWVVLPWINSIAPEPPPAPDFNFKPELPATVITPEPALLPIVLLPLRVKPLESTATISPLPTKSCISPDNGLKILKLSLLS